MDSRVDIQSGAIGKREGLPLRVAIFDPFGNIYGSEQSMLDLLRAHPRTEAEPVAIAPRGADWLPELRSLGVRYYDSFERDLHKRSRARGSLRLQSFMTFAVRERLDLVHLNQVGAAPYALMAGEQLPLPVVLHSRWHEDAESIAGLRRGVGQLARIVCISEFQRGIIASQNRVGADKLVVIRSPYDIRPAPDPASARAKDHRQPLFVCPARLHPTSARIC